MFFPYNFVYSMNINSELSNQTFQGWSLKEPKISSSRSGALTVRGSQDIEFICIGMTSRLLDNVQNNCEMQQLSYHCLPPNLENQNTECPTGMENGSTAVTAQRITELFK